MIPGLGAAIGNNLDALKNDRAATGLIGLVGLILSGLRIIDSATVATSRVFGVKDTANPVKKKLRDIGVLFVLGILAVLGAAAGAVAGIRVEGPMQVLLSLGGTGLSLALDTLMFAAAYRLLTAANGPPWPALWPGALLAGSFWTVFKLFGSIYVARQVSGASAVYGSLASVVAALVFLALAGQLYLYGAELNALRAERTGWRPKHPGPPRPGRRADSSAYDRKVGAGSGTGGLGSAEEIDSGKSADSTVSSSVGGREEPARDDAPARVQPAPAPPTTATSGRGPWSSLRPALALIAAGAALALAARFTASQRR